MPAGMEVAGIQTNELPGTAAGGEVSGGVWTVLGQAGLTGDGVDEEGVRGRAMLEQYVREADLACPGQGEGHAGGDAVEVGVGECDGIGCGEGGHGG